jgi:hypothetical protein
MAERTRAGVEPSGTGQLRTVIAAFYLGLIAVVVAAIFAGRAANGLAIAVAAKPTPPKANPIPNPISYHDAHKLFTVTMPRTWHVSSATGGIAVGDTKGVGTITTYTITIKPPSNDGAHKGDALFIYEYPLPNAAARQWQCSLHSMTNTRIDGLNATQLNDQSVWLLDTTSAHYQIDVAYPGAVIVNPGGPAIQHPTPTPVSASARASQSLMLAIFASFKPTPAKPLTCT